PSAALRRSREQWRTALTASYLTRSDFKKGPANSFARSFLPHFANARQRSAAGNELRRRHKFRAGLLENGNVARISRCLVHRDFRSLRACGLDWQFRRPCQRRLCWTHRGSATFLSNHRQLAREVLVDAATGLRLATDDGTREIRRETY